MKEEKNPSETVPGGRYKQGDVYVNANGEVLKEEKKAEEKPKDK